MEQLNPIFKKNYTDYLKRLDTVDFSVLPSVLGITVDEERRIAHLPFFQTDYQASASGVADKNGNRPGYDTCVILLKYILMCPKQVPRENDWVNFRDFKTSGYTRDSSLADNAIHAITRYYTGNINRLEKAAGALRGRRPEKEYPYKLSMVFPVLPRIPILFLFNDAEAPFQARALILFERRAEHFLDAECLAMMGSSLFKHLKQTEARNVQWTSKGITS